MRAPVLAWSTAVLVACASSAPPTVPTQAFVEAALGNDVPSGSVAVSVTQAGGACTDDSQCAQVEAVRALLFTGVPGSTVPRAIVANETRALEQYPAVFEALFEGDGYRRYVVRSEVADSRDGWDTWVVVVNHDALRRHLEDERVIRKFGLRGGAR